MEWLHNISDSFLKRKSNQDQRESSGHYDTDTVQGHDKDKPANSPYTEIKIHELTGIKDKKQPKTKAKTLPVEDDHAYSEIEIHKITKKNDKKQADEDGYTEIGPKGKKTKKVSKTKDETEDGYTEIELPGPKAKKQQEDEHGYSEIEISGVKRKKPKFPKKLSKTKDETEDGYTEIELPGAKGKKKFKTDSKDTSSDEHEYTEIDLPGTKGKKTKKKFKSKAKHILDDDGVYELVDESKAAKKDTKTQDSSDYEIADQKGGKSKKPKSTGDEYDYVRRFGGLKNKRPPSITAETTDGDYAKLLMGTRDKEKQYDVPQTLKEGEKTTKKPLKLPKAKPMKGKAKKQSLVIEEEPYVNNDYTGASTAISDILQQFTVSAKRPSAFGVEEKDYENHDFLGEKTKDKKKTKKGGAKTAEEDEEEHYENHDYDGKTLSTEESQKVGKSKKPKSTGDEYDYVRRFGGLKKKRPPSITAETTDGDYAKLLMGTRDKEKQYDVPQTLKEGEIKKGKKNSRAKKSDQEQCEAPVENDYYVNDYPIGLPSSGGSTNRLRQFFKGKRESGSEAAKEEESPGYEIMEHGELKKTASGSKLAGKMKSAMKGKSDGYDYIQDIGALRKALKAKKISQTQ